MPSEGQLVVLGGLHTYKVASAIFATAPLRSRDNRNSRNLPFRLKCKNSRAAVADYSPNPSATGAAIDDEDTLTVAFRTSTDAVICHGKFATFHRTLACRWGESVKTAPSRQRKRTTCHGLPLQLLKWGIVVAVGAQCKALGYSRLRLAYNKLVLAERAASTCVAALDEDALRQRPRVFACGAVKTLGLDGNKLHVTAAAATT